MSDESCPASTNHSGRSVLLATQTLGIEGQATCGRPANVPLGRPQLFGTSSAIVLWKLIQRRCCPAVADLWPLELGLPSYGSWEAGDGEAGK